MAEARAEVTEAELRRQHQLERRRERERQSRQSETAEQRQERLLRRRIRDRARRANESAQQRDARLEATRTQRRQRLANETTEERDIRLEAMRTQRRDRLANETTEEREIRLEAMRSQRTDHLANETTEHRESRLQHRRQTRQLQPQERLSSFQLLNQPSIQTKMKKFHSYFSSLQSPTCSTCLESFPGLQIRSPSTECARCYQDKHIPKLYSSTNNLDPGPIPPDLQGLTQIEQMLISAALPIMSLYKLPLGQYAYSGHIINLPQDVTSFANTLPRLVTELDIIIIKKQGASDSHHNFHVRRSVVFNALQWLIRNNKYYKNITINSEALDMLPEDDNVNNLPSVYLESTDSSDDIEEPSEHQDPYNSILSGSFVPTTVHRMTEQETVRQSVQQRLQSATTPTVPWPTIGSSPINEFTTEGYMSCAFPTLFPTGAADFVAPRPIPVTIGNFFKHLMMYQDGRFAKHPRFRYFALNTEMRWRALQNGRIYIRQHPHDAQLSVEELQQMIGSDGESFSNRVLHYATSLRGTRQYWFQQRSRLIAMVDTLGLPTIFFTHSAADIQWPELAQLICPDDQHSTSARNKAIQENPAIADWFFYQRIVKFIDAFYSGVLGATDYWFRFEWQHRGSPHVHGLAWLSDAPDIKQILANTDIALGKQTIIDYVNKIVSTTNPTILPDGSNIEQAPLPKTNPHICNLPYTEVVDFDHDLADLIATCQRHTRCSASYCLRTCNNQQQCRFGYPKPFQPDTTLITEDDDCELLTARNDSFINSYNPVQLSAWRANVDMQYCVSRRKVIEYCAKYATKSEPRSQPLKDIFASIVRTLNEENSSLKAVQKLLINSIADRDYSAQETCHLLLQLPMFKTSRNFVVLSMDGSRALDDNLDQDQPATLASLLDHYISRPATELFENMNLLHFVQGYTVSKMPSAQPSKRTKKIVVIVRPYYSADPQGPKYEQYCQQKLMLHVPFRHHNELLNEHANFATAYASFLQSGTIPLSLEDDIHQLQQLSDQYSDDDTDNHHDQHTTQQHPRAVEEWMLICHNVSNLHPSTDSQDDITFSTPSQAYTNLEEMPTFISRHRESATQQSFMTFADSDLLQGKQFEAYNLVKQHLQATRTPLRLIVSGTAGTGKSYLIHCLRLLLQHRVRVSAPTGVASFNIQGHTLHSLLRLPVKGDFKELQGQSLHEMQQSLANMEYLIIDEMSMVGRTLLGQVDNRLRQVFPDKADRLFGGCSCLLFGDFGQLPPVMDLPLFTTVCRSQLSDQGSAAYHQFDQAIVLNQVMRQSGQHPDQVLFREILLRLRNAQVTTDDWRLLMTQTPANIHDRTPFDTALYLHPTIEAVVEHNVTRLQHNGQPIARIKAVHTGPNAAKASVDDAGGLEPILCLAEGARVMLTANLWVERGLVNGAMGTVIAICYHSDSQPPNLPIAVTVQFDSYNGPTLYDGTVPICPLRRTWSTPSGSCSRLQLPLKLAWAVTIHKSQGLTLNKVIINVGKKEFSTGLSFVACSRVRTLKDLLFDPPFPYQRINNLAKSLRLQDRLTEDARLLALEQITLPHLHSSITSSSMISSSHMSTPCLNTQDTQVTSSHLCNLDRTACQHQSNSEYTHVQCTPSPSTQWMNQGTHFPSSECIHEATSSLPSQCMNQGTPSQWMDEATHSPPSQCFNTTLSPPSHWMDQSTPTPPSHWMDKSTPSPPSQWINQGSLTPLSQRMDEATPSSPSQWINQQTPTPPSHWMDEATPSPPSHWMNQGTPTPLSQWMDKASPYIHHHST